eukprot:1136200_1
MGNCIISQGAKRHSENGIVNFVFSVFSPQKKVDIKGVSGPLSNQMDANTRDEIVATIEDILLHTDEENRARYQKYYSRIIGLLVFMILFGGLSIRSLRKWSEIGPVLICTFCGVTLLFIIPAMAWMGRIVGRAAKHWRKEVVQAIHTQMHEWSVQWPQFQMSYYEIVTYNKGKINSIRAILKIAQPLIPDCNTPVFLTSLHDPQTLLEKESMDQNEEKPPDYTSDTLNTNDGQQA